MSDQKLRISYLSIVSIPNVYCPSILLTLLYCTDINAHYNNIHNIWEHTNSITHSNTLGNPRELTWLLNILCPYLGILKFQCFWRADPHPRWSDLRATCWLAERNSALFLRRNPVHTHTGKQSWSKNSLA